MRLCLKVTLSKKLEIPSYARICKIVAAKNLPKFSGELKIPAFLHSILHIEYSAIDIALDDCYRFCALPSEFYADFLEVANDEFKHFNQLAQIWRSLDTNMAIFRCMMGCFLCLKIRKIHSLNEWR